jgi:hypothetical protein
MHLSKEASPPIYAPLHIKKTHKEERMRIEEVYLPKKRE